jgi:hypothetical protein
VALTGTGKGAFLVAEELGRDQRRGGAAQFILVKTDRDLRDLL